MDSLSTFVDSTQETERQKVEPIAEKIYQPRQGEKAKVREDSQATDSEESSLPPLHKERPVNQLAITSFFNKSPKKKST